MVLSSWRMACNVDWQLQVQQFDPTDEFTTGSSPKAQKKRMTYSKQYQNYKEREKRYLDRTLKPVQL